MDKKKYASVMLDLANRLKYERVVGLCLALAVILLSYKIMTIETAEKTIITPVQVDSAFSVKSGQASSEYYAMMGKFFTGLMQHYHPKNASSQFDVFLRYVDPKDYPLMKARMSAEAEKIKRMEMTSIFHVMNVEVNRGRVIVTGEQTVSVGSAQISSGTRSYALDFKYNDSLTIKSFSEVKYDNDLKRYVTIQASDAQ